MCYRKAIELNLHTPGLYNNLGLAMQDKNEIDEALSCYQKAIQLDNSFADAYYNMGNAIQEKGLNEKAVSFYRKAIELSPDYAEAHYNMSLLFLSAGNFKEGWREYEWRLKTENKKPFPYSQPLWRGEFNTGTILLHSEQGLGDTIQFIRYARPAADRCREVIVVCRNELLKLLENVKGIAQVITNEEQLPDFDFHCPLLSLPFVFDTNFLNIPSEIPYMVSDKNITEKWKKKIQVRGPGFRIGLVWSGNPKYKNDKRRSFPLKTFDPLSVLENVVFFSLQKGKAAEEISGTAHGLKIADYSEALTDFTETAGLIDNLDLVISADTAVAHLAGAMGKNIWTLLPFEPDWRWLSGREDSPWYPTMRLFRQNSPGNWDTVIAAVKDEILKLFWS